MMQAKFRLPFLQALYQSMGCNWAFRQFGGEMEWGSLPPATVTFTTDIQPHAGLL